MHLQSITLSKRRHGNARVDEHGVAGEGRLRQPEQHQPSERSTPASLPCIPEVTIALLQFFFQNTVLLQLGIVVFAYCFLDVYLLQGWS
uniref:Uncharacterized protein n=1 Tax=Arundo donax TaxID=35708 RepID=A0A0A8XYK9_ARUDO